MTWKWITLSAPLCAVLPGLLAATLIAAPLPAGADEDGDVAVLAMSTASVLMMGEHEHEIEEALEEGDLEEALEEATELVLWMKGAAWHEDLGKPTKMATAALEALVARLEANDKPGAEAAFAEMEKQFHHVHHELMEIVSGAHGH